MIKKYLILIMEGALYGFLGGALLWISLYQIYEAQLSILRSHKIDGISISYLNFPYTFLPIPILFMILAAFIRSLIEFFFQKDNHLFLSWLLTGVISLLIINPILLSGPVSFLPESVGYGWLCCIDNSSGYLLWLLTFLIIVLYTISFVLLRKLIMPKKESLK